MTTNRISQSGENRISQGGQNLVAQSSVEDVITRIERDGLFLAEQDARATERLAAEAVFFDESTVSVARRNRRAEDSLVLDERRASIQEVNQRDRPIMGEQSVRDVLRTVLATDRPILLEQRTAAIEARQREELFLASTPRVQAVRPREVRDHVVFLDRHWRLFDVQPTDDVVVIDDNVTRVGEAEFLERKVTDEFLLADTALLARGIVPLAFLDHVLLPDDEGRRFEWDVLDDAVADENRFLAREHTLRDGLFLPPTLIARTFAPGLRDSLLFDERLGRIRDLLAARDDLLIGDETQAARAFLRLLRDGVLLDDTALAQRALRDLMLRDGLFVGDSIDAAVERLITAPLVEVTMRNFGRLGIRLAERDPLGGKARSGVLGDRMSGRQ